MIWNNEYISLKRETTKGVTVQPNKNIKVEKSTLNTKVNTRAISQIEGKTFSHAKLIKGKVESTWSIDAFVDRENILYFLNMLTDTPTPTSLGWGLYQYNFNIETSYGLPSYTIEVSKDWNVLRSNWVVCSSLNLTSDTEAIKMTAELVGLKSIFASTVTANTSDTITINKDQAALVVAGDVLVEIGTAAEATPANDATVVSVNYTTWVITVGTWEGTYFTAGKGITLKKVAASYTSWLKVLRWLEKAIVTVGWTQIDAESFGVMISNANEAAFRLGSNYAKQIRQGERTMELDLQVDTEYSNELLRKYENLETTPFTLTLTWDDSSSILISWNIQFKEAPVDIAVNEFSSVPFKADFVDTIVVRVITTIASL